MTGPVVARSDVGPGQFRQSRDERRAVVPRRHVAAVKEDVRIASERGGPAADEARVAIERLDVQARVAELYSAVAAMGNHVHGIETVVRRQRFADLPHPVTARVEQDDIEAATCVIATEELLNQVGGVRRRRIDEHQFVAQNLCGATVLRRCQERREPLVGAECQLGNERVAYEGRFDARRQQDPRLDLLEARPRRLRFAGAGHGVPAYGSSKSVSAISPSSAQRATSRPGATPCQGRCSIVCALACSSTQ